MTDANKKRKKLLVVFVVIILVIAIIFISIVYMAELFFRSRLEYGRYGKGNNVVIYWDEPDVDLYIYSKKEVIFNQNKIYYFFETDMYLYAITKWDKYIIVDLKSNSVICDRENINFIEDEHIKVFKNRDNFIYSGKADVIYNNSDYKSFGDGTIFLAMYSKEYRLYTQKTNDGSSSQELVNECIDKFVLVDDLLYLTTENNSYLIVDINSYSIIFNSNNLSMLSKNHQDIFIANNLIN